MGTPLKSILARTIQRVGSRPDGTIVARDTKLAVVFMITPTGKIVDAKGEPFNELKERS